MPRLAREKILYDGCYGHIYSRTLEKRYIFQDGEDFECFRKLIIRTKKSYGYRLYHYCLMNTHFHMLVEIKNLEEFSKGLKEMKHEYSNWYKKKYEHKGPVWWGRFGSQLIENKRYLYACGMYIEMNPVEAGMVDSATQWFYSSARHYFKGENDVLLDEYEKPPQDEAELFMEGLNVGKGSYIGSPAFILDKS